MDWKSCMSVCLLMTLHAIVQPWQSIPCLPLSSCMPLPSQVTLRLPLLGVKGTAQSIQTALIAVSLCPQRALWTALSTMRWGILSLTHWLGQQSMGRFLRSSSHLRRVLESLWRNSWSFASPGEWANYGPPAVITVLYSYLCAKLPSVDICSRRCGPQNWIVRKPLLGKIAVN